MQLRQRRGGSREEARRRRECFASEEGLLGGDVAEALLPRGCPMAPASHRPMTACGVIEDPRAMCPSRLRRSTQVVTESRFLCQKVLFDTRSRLWRFPLLTAETATDGAKLPPCGANRRWVVAPVGAGRWRQSALGGGANVSRGRAAMWCGQRCCQSRLTAALWQCGGGLLAATVPSLRGRRQRSGCSAASWHRCERWWWTAPL